MPSLLGAKLLTGEHRCLLDEKGRLNFPAKLRDKMGETFWVTRWMDDCLLAIPEEKLETVVETLEAKGMIESREARLVLFSAAEDVTPDKQGRILLTMAQREHIELKKDAVVIGLGSYAEIWTSEDWQKRKEGFKNKNANTAILKEIGL
ncbi:MAG: division/cell wall cluster transcriptional repressor MraZ [Oscillospiraceae bacterium]